MSATQMLWQSTSMALPLKKPEWCDYLERLGRELAALPTAEFGEPSPRIILSLPTGRFSYWMLAAGALAEQPVHGRNFQPGDRVACWVDRKMRDVELEEAGPDAWRLSAGVQNLKTKFVAVRVPEGTPDDRESAKLGIDMRDRLRQVPGHERDFHVWYASHSLKPVVIVGTGREHVQLQRRILLSEAPNWFGAGTRELLTEDSSMTSNPERMLFHPFMVFDADVGRTRPWLRQMLPRIVITTSWSSHLRMHPALWSRVPQIIITNRRVRSAFDAELETLGSGEIDQFDRLIHTGRPDSVGARAFLVPAQGELPDDFDDEEFM